LVATSIRDAESKEYLQEISDSAPFSLGCAEPYKVIDLGCEKEKVIVALQYLSNAIRKLVGRSGLRKNAHRRILGVNKDIECTMTRLYTHE